MGLSLTYTSYIVEVSLSWATQRVETSAVCLLLLGAASDFLQNLIQHSGRAVVFTHFVYTPFQYALQALQHRMQCLDDSAGLKNCLDVSSGCWTSVLLSLQELLGSP